VLEAGCSASRLCSADRCQKWIIYLARPRAIKRVAGASQRESNGARQPLEAAPVFWPTQHFSGSRGSRPKWRRLQWWRRQRQQKTRGSRIFIKFHIGFKLCIMSEREQRSEPKEEHNSPNLVALDCGQRVVVVVEVAEQQQTVHPLDVHGQLARVQVGERRLLQLWFVSVGPFGFDLVCFVSFRFVFVLFCRLVPFGRVGADIIGIDVCFRPPVGGREDEQGIQFSFQPAGCMRAVVGVGVGGGGGRGRGEI